jgi:hypothetical protein
MRWGFEGRTAAFALAAVALWEPGARGDEDSSHGRVQGDASLVAGAGVAAVSGGARAEAELRLRYLETAGVFATYEDGPLVGSKVDPSRALATGLEVRPLFLFRWLKGYETPRARLDLAIDSIGLDLGAVFLKPQRASFASASGLEAGLGLELPVFAAATGPWIGLHGGMRWSEAALSSGQIRGAVDRSAYLEVTFAWHQAMALHIVDAGDRAPY